MSSSTDVIDYQISSDEENKGFEIQEDLFEDSDELKDESDNDGTDILTKTSIDTWQDNLEEDSSNVIGEPVFVKPFDYSKMRTLNHEKGTIFVRKPPYRYCNEEYLRNYFSSFGKVIRLQAAYEDRRIARQMSLSTVGSNKRRRGSKSSRKHINLDGLSGYYIEFQEKSIAKRVALSVDMREIDHQRDTRPLQVRYLPNFSWGELEEEDGRAKLAKRLLLAEAQKELRELKQYQRNAEWSKKLKKDPEKAKKYYEKNGKNSHYVQKKIKKHEPQEGEESHLHVISLLGS